MPEKAIRLNRLYCKLKKGAVTIDALIKWASLNGIEISPRTLYRDMEEIEAIAIDNGHELVSWNGEQNKKYWKLQERGENNNPSIQDLISLQMFKSFIPLCLSNKRLRTLENSMESLLLAQKNTAFERFGVFLPHNIASSNYSERSYSDDQERLLEDLAWAVQQNKEIVIASVANDYTSLPSDLTYPLKLQPVQIIYHRGSIHLGGLIANSDKVFLIAIEQLEAFELTNRSFASKETAAIYQRVMNDRFGITENINDEVYDIRLEFPLPTGNFVAERTWHHSQQFEKLEKGNILMKLTCGINRELVGWLFQWMGNVTIHGPQILRSKYQVQLSLIKENLELNSTAYYTNIFSHASKQEKNISTISEKETRMFKVDH
jgi:predicted DNA-binding transcriptional regulator YafY